MEAKSLKTIIRELDQYAPMIDDTQVETVAKMVFQANRILSAVQAALVLQAAVLPCGSCIWDCTPILSGKPRPHQLGKATYL